MCTTHKVSLYKLNKTGVNSEKLSLDLFFKTFEKTQIPPATRSEQVCSCQICIVAKGPVRAGNFKKFSGAAKKVLSPIPENSPVKTGPEPRTKC